ncbi:MAG TPA: Fur family transcriptional regulator [Bradyrhizobium sp.]|nr:Fur family transcriptional regulator [Bradyrhizobium sp.]
MDLATATPWIEIEAAPLAADGTEMRPEAAFDEGEQNHLLYDCSNLLRQAGLRPTRQRLMLGAFLFSKGGRHVTADMIYTEAVAANIPISRATVYNTLNQFTHAGLLRQIGVDGSKSFFDTNPGAHHHFFVDHEDRLLDVPAPGVAIEQLPEPLPGYEVVGVDVIVHLRQKSG